MSQTGIGKTGQYHILTQPQDDSKFLFDSQMWCTHPLLGSIDILGGGEFALNAGSKIVVGINTNFTLLCNNFSNNNIPINKYIACWDEAEPYYLILEVDYVIDDSLLILKTPSPIELNINAVSDSAVQIDQFGTPILNEVEVRDAAPIFNNTVSIANKYGYNQTIAVGHTPLTYQNEGGLEPMLILQDSNIIVTLKY